MAEEAGAATKQIGLLKKLEDELKAAKDARPNLTSEAEIASSNQLIASLEGQIKKLNELGIGSKEMAKAYADVQKSFRTIGNESLALGDQFKYLEARQAADQAGVKRLLDAGYSPFSAKVKELVGDLRNLNVTLADNALLSARTLKGSEKQFETPDFKLNTPDRFELPELLLPDYGVAFRQAAQQITAGNGMLFDANQIGQFRFTQAQADFNTNTEALLDQFPIGALSGLGEALGGALAGGGDVLEAGGKALLKSLAQIGAQYGQLLIALGIADIATGFFVAKGVGEIAAGTGLIAASGLLGALAGGGSSSGGGSRPSTSPSSSPRTYAPAQQTAAAPAPVTVTHEVIMVQKGGDLYGVLQIATNRRGRMVGGG